MPFHIGERQNTPIVFLRQRPPETPRKKTTLPSIERKIESVHQSRLSPKRFLLSICLALHLGLKKADQQIILDDFNKYGPGWVYSKQGCVNEGSALGRGAATSGFNKFIELTEAAKDLKDGSLSQDCSRSLKAPSLEFPEYIKQRGYDLHDVQAYLKIHEDYEDIVGRRKAKLERNAPVNKNGIFSSPTGITQ
ncbi:hypothetical protein F2Q69_00060504 [Brassica cretica]|uniref:Uncharacterized protein n=1 Tax=Brassica cretica TaxID=69181 RepID=A0A8S9RN49_BRACR|nr:hypothetical protein F2Q69_00060504 [Brassica cretica]